MKRPYANPECPKCNGEGWIYAKSMITLPGDRGGRDCDCTLDHHRRVNMERVWPSLSEAREIPGLRENCPLFGLVGRNIWITAKEGALRRHLKALCYRNHHLWSARVWTDADILKAWLNTMYAQGHKIFDTELDDVRITAMNIDELVEPYDLVILKLGVKNTPNKEAGNGVLDALSHRRHLGRPTWVVDQPDHPVDRIEHRCYSEKLEGILSHWPHVALSSSGGIKIVGGSVHEAPEPVSEMDADDVVEEAGEAIDDALADLEDDEEVEDGGGDDDEEEIDEEVEDGGGDDDEEEIDEEGGEEGDEEDEDEYEEDEEEVDPGTRNFLNQMADNEEVQEEQARRKAYRSRGKKKKPFRRKGK